MNPTVSFGRPVIVGTGIPISAIYELYRAGDSVADLAEDFRLDTSAIEEVIRSKQPEVVFFVDRSLHGKRYAFMEAKETGTRSGCPI